MTTMETMYQPQKPVMTQAWQPTNEQEVRMTVAQGTPRTDQFRKLVEESWKNGGYQFLTEEEWLDEYGKLEAENAALSAQVVELQKLYNELLYGVARKYPDETRHQTALRYINHAETVHSSIAKAQVPPSVKDSGNDNS